MKLQLCSIAVGAFAGICLGSMSSVQACPFSKSQGLNAPSSNSSPTSYLSLSQPNIDPHLTLLGIVGMGTAVTAGILGLGVAYARREAAVAATAQDIETIVEEVLVTEAVIEPEVALSRR